MKNQHVFSSVKPILIATAIALGVTACSLPNAPATKAAAQMSKPFTNGEILHVMHVVNTAEIKQSELALQRSTDPKVREVAQMMILDHTTLNQRIATMAQTTGTKMEESTLSKGLQMQAGQIIEGMAKLSGTEFDCNYLQKQAEQHALTLDTVRNQLLPAAENPQTKQLLTAAAPRLEQHRKVAQEARAANSKCPRS